MKKFMVITFAVFFCVCTAGCTVSSLTDTSSSESVATHTQATYYYGEDPWGGDLVVCVDSMTNSITYIEELDNEHILVDTITPRIVNGTTDFEVEESWEDLEAHYSGTITRDNDYIVVVFEEGQTTSISPDGGGASKMAEIARDSGTNAVVLNKR